MVKKQLGRTRTLLTIALIAYGIDSFDNWDDLRQNWTTLFQKVTYGIDFYQTLTIIAFTQLLILPVIARPLYARALCLLMTLTVYIVGDKLFWFKGMYRPGYVDGGSFAIFSWSTCILTGTVLNDWAQWSAGKLRLNDDEGAINGNDDNDDNDKSGLGRMQRMLTWFRRFVMRCGLIWRSCTRSNLQRVGFYLVPLLLGSSMLMVLAVTLSTFPQSWSPVCYLGRSTAPCSDEGLFLLFISLKTIIVDLLSKNALGFVSWPFVLPPSDVAVSMFTIQQRGATFTYAIAFLVASINL